MCELQQEHLWGLSEHEVCGKGEGHPGRGAGMCRSAAWGASWCERAGVRVLRMTCPAALPIPEEHSGKPSTQRPCLRGPGLAGAP